MASLGFTFNPNDVPEDDGSFELIPANVSAMMQFIEVNVVMKDYAGIQIDDMQLAEKRRDTWKIQIMDGPFAGKEIWGGWNTKHPNEKTEEISAKQLARACIVTGVGAIDNTDQLLFKPFTGVTSISKGTGNYKDKNDIDWRKSQPTGAKAAVAPARASAPQRQAEPAKPIGNKPWETKAA